ncbi:LysE family translocator [Nocardioides convexus]|uniref:LysE family translocator n=1 Tax=Nocardioides convexus TaxID=2712224 RepID=UPI0024187158|nr:LysE family translocator [Nocardioides convexus]
MHVLGPHLMTALLGDGLRASPAPSLVWMSLGRHVRRAAARGRRRRHRVPPRQLRRRARLRADQADAGGARRGVGPSGQHGPRARREHAPGLGGDARRPGAPAPLRAADPAAPAPRRRRCRHRRLARRHPAHVAAAALLARPGAAAGGASRAAGALPGCRTTSRRPRHGGHGRRHRPLTAPRTRSPSGSRWRTMPSCRRPARLAAFAIASFLFIQVPGPSLLFTIGRALTVGRRDALLSVVGNGLGLVAQVALVAVGLGAVVAASTTAFTVLKIAGAAYVAYLGVQAIRHRSDARAALTASGAGDDAPARSGLTSVRTGLLVGTTNPKTIVFFVAFLPQFIDDGAAAAPQPAAPRRALRRHGRVLGHVLGAGRRTGAGLVRPQAAAPRRPRRGRRGDDGRPRPHPGDRRQHALSTAGRPLRSAAGSSPSGPARRSPAAARGCRAAA